MLNTAFAPFVNVFDESEVRELAGKQASAG